MDAFQFAEAHGKVKLNIAGSVGIVGQVKVVVKTVVLRAQPQGQVPFQAEFFPVFIPFHFFSGPYKKLHFHLFKLAHTKNKLAGHNFIAESLARLGNAKRYFHSAGFLNVKEVNENTLSGFGPQINFTRFIGQRADFGREHQVKLAHVGPVARARFGVGNFQICNKLPESGHIACGPWPV
ncbi:MAG: hypothetical protein KatS3mg032_0872 [Cyclobacteriaceae bacterium]|nr:MAG: hypothetical protein KatS3mg032_0872 [Cyclobacteriaceae bacterium]